MSYDEGQREVIELLEEQGVPTFLAEEVAGYKPNWVFTVLYFISSMALFLGVMSLGFILGVVLFSGSSVALHEAAAAQAVLYDDKIGLSMVVLLFGWIFCSGIILVFLFGFTPLKVKVPAFILALTWGGVDGPFARARLRHSMKEHPSPISTKELINNWGARYIKAFSKIAIPILIVGVGIYSLERDSWAYVNKDGFTENPVNPLKTTATIPWNELLSVELGCNHTDDGDYIIYKIRAASRSARLSSFQALNNREDLDALIEIDSYIRNHRGVEFKRWEWLSRDPLHPACLHHFSKTLDDEKYSRLATLLKVGEFPGD